MHPGLENAAAKRLSRDTVDDIRYVANLLIDADSLLAMDNYVRQVCPLTKEEEKKENGEEKTV